MSNIRACHIQYELCGVPFLGDKIDYRYIPAGLEK